MKFLALDDEQASLDVLCRALSDAVPEAEIRSFRYVSAALDELLQNGFQPDAAFLDIEMPGMSGLELAKRIREISPKTNIVFATAYSEYATDAFRLHASGFLMKPATVEKVLRVQCFGNFEVFAGGKPMSFTYKKTKELLAYLIDRRGSACNTAELCAALWEDKPDTPEMHKYLRKLLADLSHTLAQAGAEEAIAKSRNSFAVLPDKIDCDYYRFLKREISAINTYTGEYMTQYSWADMTLGALRQVTL